MRCVGLPVAKSPLGIEAGLFPVDSANAITYNLTQRASSRFQT
jgi:hypothetical protein